MMHICPSLTFNKNAFGAASLGGGGERYTLGIDGGQNEEVDMRENLRNSGEYSTWKEEVCFDPRLLFLVAETQISIYK